MSTLSKPPADLNSFVGRKWLESLVLQSTSVSSVLDLSFILISPDASLPNSRGLSVNSALTLVDGGPGLGVTLGLNLNNANTWLQDQSVPDEVYGAGWNGSFEVPTKNAVYDKIELLSAIVPTLQQVLTSGATSTVNAAFTGTTKISFGTTNVTSLASDGTNFIINPAASGSGDVLIGATADQDLRCNFMGVGTSAISPNAIINCNTSGAGRGALAFTYAKTGGTNAAVNINSTLNYQLALAAAAVGVQSVVSEQVNNTGTSNYTCFKGTWTSTVNLTGGSHIFEGAILDGGAGPTDATGATVTQVGLHIYPMSTFTNATSNIRIGAIFEHDVLITDGNRLYFEGVASTFTVGDTYMVYTAGTTSLDTVVNGTTVYTYTPTTTTFADAHNLAFNATTGTKFGTATTQKIGIWNATPIVRPSAYTQTYSTATKTHSNPTASAISTTGSTNVTPFGYTTAAQADAIVAAINALIVDVANTKQVVNAIIDDQQAIGWFA